MSLGFTWTSSEEKISSTASHKKRLYHSASHKINEKTLRQKCNLALIKRKTHFHEGVTVAFSFYRVYNEWHRKFWKIADFTLIWTSDSFALYGDICKEVHILNEKKI